MKGWWLRRSLAFRVSLVVAFGSLALLLVLVLLSGNLLGTLSISAADEAIAPRLNAARSAVAHGSAVAPPSPGITVRVLDTAGDPVDGGARTTLDRHELDALKAGEPVNENGEPMLRWLGGVVTAPDGAQRLVTAAVPLTGYGYLVHTARQWMIGGAVLGAAGVGVLCWLAIRFVLRPIRKMRAAARELPTGQRLPEPVAHDELHELTAALNGLLQRRDEATARLQRFTGDAAHELRSPVTAIRAQAEVAVLHPDPEDAQEVLAEIEAEAQRLSTLVEDLLVLARSDAGRIAQAQAVDLAFAVHAAIERLGAGTPVWFEAPAGECSVLAAAPEVKVVLDNLLRNARRYAHAHIRVSVLPSGRSVRLLVDDDGPGIAAEHRAKVFDRFYRLADDRARDSGGSGLGLALVAELVRARRGSVRVTDSPEGGARFDVRWPAAR
ncbi:sensor histidine kinase [Sciscionella sediminilitoris]|uniref:sensor histidine kinase n=1 Tax=Sciscionella sediminilitoris TaxID=1445613 RepID=UPI0004DF30C8|nr:ATP-binding protein [Sciscionella sp. SE31]